MSSDEHEVQDEAIANYRSAAERVSAARLRYSQAFQMAHASRAQLTDGRAHQIAIEETGDELTKLEAEQTIARIKLEAAFKC